MKNGFRHQPMGPQNVVVTKQVIVITTDLKTGQTMIESGNGVPLNPLNVISVCLSVATANLNAYMKQASGLVGGNSGLKIEKAAHNFVARDDNSDICSYCDENQENHRSNNAS